jgi:hypothetical protein
MANLHQHRLPQLVDMSTVTTSFGLCFSNFRWQGDVVFVGTFSGSRSRF